MSRRSPALPRNPEVGAGCLRRRCWRSAGMGLPPPGGGGRPPKGAAAVSDKSRLAPAPETLGTGRFFHTGERNAGG